VPSRQPIKLNAATWKLRLNWPKRPSASDSEDGNAKKSKSLICSKKYVYSMKPMDQEISQPVVFRQTQQKPLEWELELLSLHRRFFNGQRLHPQKYSESLGAFSVLPFGIARPKSNSI
jgi:hypothetical protein